MASYDQHDFSRGHLVQDAFLPQHPMSMALSAPSSFSISLPTAMSYQHDHCGHSSYYYTPRTIAPQPGYVTAFSPHDYHHDETYTVSSNSTSARGRSGSGTSTASVGYSVVSPRTTPMSPYSLSGADSQYRATYDDQMIGTEGPVSSSQRQPSSLQKEGPSLTQGDDGHSSSNEKTVTDHRMFCPHKDCLDGDGKPKKFFSRKADVTRHHKSRHDVTYLDCPRKNCDRKGRQGFTRRDHLTEHLRGFHMENIAKRQMANTKDKRSEKEASEDTNESRSSSEGLTPTHSAVAVPASHSGGSSFTDQAGQHLKQELQSSSDEDTEDGFVMVEDYRSTTTKRVKTLSYNHVGKAKVAQLHPYQRRPSKSQPRQIPPDVKSRNMSQQLTVSPEFATSPMMPHSPVFATHQAVAGQYTSSHMPSPLYATHQGVDPFYHASSIAQGYHGLQAHPTSRYSMDAMNEFHFQHVQE